MSVKYIIAPTAEQREVTPALRVMEHQLSDGEFRDWFALEVDREQGGDVHTPVGLDGRRFFPVEASTGIPLPIIVKRNGVAPNLHHAFSEKNQFARGTLGQQATRFSRLQRVGIPAHDNAHRKHRYTAAFGLEYEEHAGIILSASGYVPPFGIADEYDMQVKELSSDERRRLRKPGIITVERDWEARATIGEVVLGYGLTHDYDSKWQLYIEEFLSISPEVMVRDKLLRQRKLYLGVKLADRAIAVAVDPVTPKFIEARNSNLLRKHAPPRPWEVMKNMVRGLEAYHISLLEDTLTRRYLGSSALASVVTG